MIDKPLYQNPLGGGLSFRQEGDMGRYVADNDPGGIAAGFSNLEDYLAAGNQLPQLPTGEPLKGVSPLTERIVTQEDGIPFYNMFNVTPPSVPVSEQTPMSGLPQPTEGVSQDVFGNPNYLDGTPSVNPIVTGPQEIASAETQPYNRVGQQLTGPGFNQSNDILETLQNIEKGIASLGQGNMNQSSFGGFNNNFGIGSFFPPYGGMYGK